MTEVEVNDFNFAALDGLAFAAERGKLDGRPIPMLTAQEIGPVLELARLSECRLLPAPQGAPWLELNGFGPMVQALYGGRTNWICPTSRLIGFLRTAPTLAPGDVAWTAFGLAAQKAATEMGFPRSIAAQLTAALGELHSNVYEHSQAPETGVVAFSAHRGWFEFVASDRGIGVLESLRSGPDHATLNDHGEALRLTLTDGVSRFGSNSDRGHGFRPLFIGLANLNGALRFRSGDHALLIDGRNPSLMTARSAQKTAIQGFFVSVTCQTNGISRPKVGCNSKEYKN